MADSKKKNTLSVVLGALVLFAIVLSTFGATYAHYNKTSVCSLVYGESREEKSTLSAEGKIFDFGIWRSGSANALSHTLVLESAAALNGTLALLWDSATAAANDVAIEGGVGERHVSEADGTYSVPISMHVSSSRSAVASLDVSWTPDGATAPTLTARYFIALNPETSAAQAITFGGSTGFLSRDLLHFEATAPSGSHGLIVTPGEGLAQNFKAGTKYYNSTYPQGVTLLSDSAIYLPCENGKVSAVLNVGENVGASTFKLCVGTSTENYSTTTLTPKSEKALSVTTDSDVILSHTNPFTVSIAEAATLHDAAWNTAGSGAAQLSWSIERLVGGEYVPVSTGDNLTAKLERTATGGSITLGAPTGEQPAGTYRMKITQKYNGLKVGQITKWFFIDYR